MPVEDVPTRWSARRAVQHQPSRDWDWLLLQCGFLEEWIKAEGVPLNVQKFGRLQSIPRIVLRLAQHLYCCGLGVAVLLPHILEPVKSVIQLWSVSWVCPGSGMDDFCLATLTGVEY